MTNLTFIFVWIGMNQNEILNQMDPNDDVTFGVPTVQPTVTILVQTNDPPSCEANLVAAMSAAGWALQSVS